MENQRIEHIPVQLSNIYTLSVFNNIITDMTVSMLSDIYHGVILTEWLPEKVPEAKSFLPSDKSLNFLQFLADNPHSLEKRTKINLRNRLREQHTHTKYIDTLSISVLLNKQRLDRQTLVWKKSVQKIQNPPQFTIITLLSFTQTKHGLY